MAQQTVDDVEEWVMALDRPTLARHATALELRSEGTKLGKANRLARWLLGEYTAADFEPDEAPDAMARRVEARRTFIMDTTSMWAIEQADESQNDHPLSGLLQDDQVREKLNRTTGIPATAAPTSQETAPDNRSAGNGGEEDGFFVDEDGVRYMRITSPEGQQYKVPVDFGIVFANLIGRVSALERSFNSSVNSNEQRPRNVENPMPTSTPAAAASTRYEDRRVRMQDTFTTHYPATEGHSRIQQHLPRVDAPRPLLGRGYTNTHNRGDAAEDERWPTSQQNTTMGGQARDVGQLVRKWQVRFAGDGTTSIDTFLDRVEDARRSANLTPEQMLAGVSELLTGKADTWYAPRKERIHTWEQFKDYIRQWFGAGAAYQRRLLTEAMARTQGSEESVCDYLTCITAITYKMSPRPSEKEELDIAYRNMLPHLQKHIRRTAFSSIEQLLELAREVEDSEEAARTYRPPPEPTASLLPEVAYIPKNTPKPKPTQIAAAGYNPPEKKESTEMLKQISSILESTLGKYLKKEEPSKNPPTNTNNRQEETNKDQSQPTRSPRRFNNRWNGKRGGRGGYQGNRTSDEGNKTDSSQPNADQQQQSRKQWPEGPLKCKNCGMVGYSQRFCPKYQGNGTGGGQPKQ